MQVASRIIIVWGILDQFPAVAVQSLAYSTMLVAWSVTEMIRYSYFVLNLAYGRVPPALVWLRYNTFFALYPLGISSEWWLVRCAIEPARRTYGIGAEYLLRAALLIYVPGPSAWLVQWVVVNGSLTSSHRELCLVYTHDGPAKENHARKAFSKGSITNGSILLITGLYGSILPARSSQQCFSHETIRAAVFSPVEPGVHYLIAARQGTLG